MLLEMKKKCFKKGALGQGGGSKRGFKRWPMQSRPCVGKAVWFSSASVRQASSS